MYNKNLDICAVVVSFNRIQLLKECINSLLEQSYTLDKIIIVDNNSTDGTKDYLKEIKRCKPDKFNIHLLEENLGGAGGFYEGIKEATKLKMDWIWVMDDDAEPEKNCLTKLIQFINERGYKIGFVSPLNLIPQSKKIQFSHHRIINETLTHDNYINEKQININSKSIPIDANSFVGPLISSHAINKVGLPRKDFFIWDDDIEYTHRISRVSPGFVITNSYIIHKETNTNSSEVASLWKSFYGIRNRLIWINSSLSGFKKIKANYIFLNARAWKLYKSILTERTFKKWRVYLLVCMTKAVISGLLCRGGKFIDPLYYKKKINS